MNHINPAQEAPKLDSNCNSIVVTFVVLWPKQCKGQHKGVNIWLGSWFQRVQFIAVWHRQVSRTTWWWKCLKNIIMVHQDTQKGENGKGPGQDITHKNTPSPQNQLPPTKFQPLPFSTSNSGPSMKQSKAQPLGQSLKYTLLSYFVFFPSPLF